MTQPPNPHEDTRLFAQISLALAHAGCVGEAADLAARYAAKVTGATLVMVAQPDRRQLPQVVGSTDEEHALLVQRAWVDSFGTLPPPPDQRTTVIDDLAADTRYPAFTSRVAAETPYRSSMSVYVAVGERFDGLFALYHEEPGYFGPDVQVMATVMAEQAAVALAAVAGHEQARHLLDGLATSRMIGAAVGIAMAVRKLTLEQGFDLLRRESQRANRKLRDVAMDVVDTGVLPG